MCGIIGYVGKNKNAIGVVIDGLKNLEYRGYDSAGITFKKNNSFDTVKSVGQIKNLEKKINYNIESSLAIGHTRWATHGIPNEINSHPHTSGLITLVHNGIIENYQELKQKLMKINVKFVSDTDTEVAAAWLNYLYESTKDMLKSLNEFKKTVKGSYALAIINSDVPDNIFVLKQSSPLIIGLNEQGYYISSDVPAILKYASDYILLDDGDFAKVSTDGINIFTSYNEYKNANIKHFEGDEYSINKSGYEHFMLKEINEEPVILRKLLDKYGKNIKILPDISSYKRITIVACGSAMHAGLLGKYIIEKNMNVPVEVEIASEYRYKKLFLDENDLIIAISQSGETADTLAAIKISKAMGAKTLGIVNVKESTIAREVDDVIYTEAGSEIAVATTKGYLTQSLILYLLACRNKKIDYKKFEKAPIIAENLINDIDKYEKLASRLKDCEDIFFIGRLNDYALCMEASLKIKEISYIHSEAYPAGELKHGSISLVDKGVPVFGIVTNEKIADKTISNLKEVRARGAYVILIVSEDLNIIGDIYDEKIVIPYLNEELTDILSIIPAQYIAYLIAKNRGCSIDKPRNLAKSVTVE